MKVIFLDRDGVINEYPGDTKFVTSWKEFKFIPGSLNALRRLTEAGFDIFVISNQSGVSKGVYSKDSLEDITKRMFKEVKKNNGRITEAIYCMEDDDNCDFRKPKPGMIKLVLKKYNTKKEDLKSLFFVGDTIRDIKTGKSVGLKTILVFSGKEKKENKENWEEKPDYVAKNLNEAVDLVLKGLR